MHLGGPKALADPVLLESRLALVHSEPRVADLNRWVSEVRADTGTPIPWFDPADGGAEARILLLLETPGRMADAARGSGIISIDNNDDTARNLWEFRLEAELTGTECVHWNAVPEFIGGKVPTAAEVRDGSRHIPALLALLPEVRVVVLMGAHAQRAWAQHCLRQRTQVVAISTWHPSKLGLAAAGRRDQASAAVRAAAAAMEALAPLEPLQPRRAVASPSVTAMSRRGFSSVRKRSADRIRAVRAGLRR